MIFRDVQSSLVDIFGAAESGRYRTIGYKDRPASSDSVINSDRTIMVYYETGSLDGSGGGPADHNTEFVIELSVSSPAEADLAVLENSASTDVQRAVALANMQDSRDLANQSLDELIEIVFEIIFDNRNLDLGLDIGVAADRWISKINKQKMVLMGSLMVMTAEMRLTCHMVEEFIGEVPIEAVTPFQSVEINTQGDEETKSLMGVDV